MDNRVPLTIDASKDQILIDGVVRTGEISFFAYDSSKRAYGVMFVGSKKVYFYGKSRFTWLRRSEDVDIANCRFFRNGIQLEGLAYARCFADFTHSVYYLKFVNGKELSIDSNCIEIVTSCLHEPKAANVFSYLQAVASVNGISTEGGESLLKKQYDNFYFIPSDRAISFYLSPCADSLSIPRGETLIYPFGCNSSQKRAVEAAFDNRVSVIQGPPGTGKTQTILNIIANILMRGQTVLVVSNNNSAIKNVIDKLSKYGLGFVVAMLGNSENKQKFVEAQDECHNKIPSEVSSWRLDKECTRELLANARDVANRSERIFSAQERLAEARREYKELEVERAHFISETGCSRPSFEWAKVPSSQNILEVWNEIESIEESVQSGTLSSKAAAWIKRMLSMLFKSRKNPIYAKKNRPFLDRSRQEIVADLQISFYDIRLKELHDEIPMLERFLASEDAEIIGQELQDISMTCVKAAISDKYGSREERHTFRIEQLKRRWKEFINEYPVVLSTTFSSVASLGVDAVYDYVIMDEASQVSIETGALALACAKNAVIVGDLMQLPNVVDDETKKKIDALTLGMGVSKAYDCAANSFLGSICKVIAGVPQTLLREHYRCHPKIINFCNQKFYGGNLLIMTKDEEEENVMTAIRTVPGNHARGHINQREIDVIVAEVLPYLNVGKEEIGIIAPYNMQVDALREQLDDEIEVATVHKFQGREKDAIIMTVVDDEVSSFSDDPNLLNVAVSRAKRKFCIVVSGNEQPKGSNIGDLLDYIAYNNCEILGSKINSIFDYLYKQYHASRMEYLSRHKKVSEYDSENLTYALIEDILYSDISFSHLGIVCHQPLRFLLRDFSLLNEKEREYAGNISTHVDFVVYNKVGKQLVLAIETDGYSYHKKGLVQADRDAMKNHIFAVYDIPLVRLSTTGSGEKVLIESKLRELLRL